ncbi:MAG TPA: hypothetical protein VKH43_13050 [Thermoanaerobaculia bacterium]|nr:hypothetical protein [Thermoanaerobaculia bacterium]
MKSRRASISIVGGLVFSFLSAGVAMAGAGGNERMSRIERADQVQARRTQTRKEEKFRSEKTDSWLCNYVSAFFCTSAFPTLSTAPEPPANPAVPYRGRN